VDGRPWPKTIERNGVYGKEAVMLLEDMKAAVLTEYRAVAEDLATARAAVDKLGPRHDALTRLIESYGWKPGDKIVTKPKPQNSPESLARVTAGQRAVEKIVEMAEAEHEAQPVRPKLPQSLVQQANQRLTYPVADAVETFTGPTGITVNVERCGVTFNSKTADEFTDREIRMVAVLAKLKAGSFLPRDFVAKSIWKRLPQEHMASVAALMPPLNVKLRRIGLHVISTMGVGLAIAPIDGA
jgi:hypothetical protein